MKKFLWPLFATSSLLALPLNNPVDPILVDRCSLDEESCLPQFCESINYRFGFYGDYIYNSKMYVDRSGDPSLRNMRVMTNAGEVVVNWCCLDLFATLGTTKIIIDSNSRSLETSGNPISFPVILNFETTFSWSVGARVALLEWNAFGFGIEGQYFRTCPDMNDSQFFIPAYQSNLTTTYSAWQVGAGLSYTYCVDDRISLNPYAGAFWVDEKFQIPSAPQEASVLSPVAIDFFNLKKDQQYGWAFGLTMAMGGFSTLTGEVRFAGEKAAFVNFQIPF